MYWIWAETRGSKIEQKETKVTKVCLQPRTQEFFVYFVTLCIGSGQMRGSKIEERKISARFSFRFGNHETLSSFCDHHHCLFNRNWSWRAAFSCETAAHRSCQIGRGSSCGQSIFVEDARGGATSCAGRRGRAGHAGRVW